MAAGEIGGVHLIKLLVDSALGKDQDRLLPLMCLMIGLMIATALSRYLSSYASGKITALFSSRLRRDLVDHITQISFAGIKKRHSSDVISRLYDDTSQIAHFVGNISNYLYKILFLIFALIYLLFLDWKIASLTFLFITVSVFFTEKFSKSIPSYSQEYQARIAESNGLIKDAVVGIDVLKAYNLENTLLSKYKERLGASLITSLKIAKQFSLSISVSNLSQSIPLLVCIAYCAFLVMKNILTASQLVAYIQLIAKLIGPTRDLPNMIFEVKRMEGMVRRILELQREEVEQTHGKLTAGAGSENAIEFSNVTFGYDGITVLENVSFQIPTGKRIAIVGRSGSGKSTLLNLISRLYTDYEGKIKVFGRDIREWNLNSLRRQLAVVLQDTYLFPGTVRENIQYGRMGADDAEIIEVSHTAIAHNFVEELIEKYDTDLGERGARLSHGQRQRVSLARALLRRRK